MKSLCSQKIVRAFVAFLAWRHKTRSNLTQFKNCYKAFVVKIVAFKVIRLSYIHNILLDERPLISPYTRLLSKERLTAVKMGYSSFISFNFKLIEESDYEDASSSTHSF